MTDEMHELLKRSWRGKSVIEYINSLEIEVDMQTRARITAVEQLREMMNENERLKQIVDADKKYVCASKPVCGGKG